MLDHDTCDRCDNPVEPHQSAVHIKGRVRHETCHLAMRPADWRERSLPLLDSNGQWAKGQN